MFVSGRWKKLGKANEISGGVAALELVTVGGKGLRRGLKRLWYLS